MVKSQKLNLGSVNLPRSCPLATNNEFKDQKVLFGEESAKSRRQNYQNFATIDIIILISWVQIGSKWYGESLLSQKISNFEGQVGRTTKEDRVIGEVNLRK